MNKLSKIGLTTAAVGLAAAAAKYGFVVLCDELLFNKNMVMPHKFNARVVNCDLSVAQQYRRNNRKWLEDYGYDKHYLISDRGELLTGYHVKPKEKSNIFVVGIHGYKSHGKREFSNFAEFYSRLGVNLFFADNIATGESEGKYCTFGYHEKEDCLKWLRYLTETFGEDIKIVLHGVSMGAATTIMLAAKKELPENVLAAICDCSVTTVAAEFEEKLRNMGAKSDKLIRDINKVNIKRVGFDIYSLRPIDDVKNVKIPMLFIHGTADTFVPCEMTKELYEACSSREKELLLVEGADHAQCYKDGKEQYEAKVIEWLNKFVF